MHPVSAVSCGIRVGVGRPYSETDVSPRRSGVHFGVPRSRRDCSGSASDARQFRRTRQLSSRCVQVHGCDDRWAAPAPRSPMRRALRTPNRTLRTPKRSFVRPLYSRLSAAHRCTRMPPTPGLLLTSAPAPVSVECGALTGRRGRRCARAEDRRGRSAARTLRSAPPGCREAASPHRRGRGRRRRRSGCRGQRLRPRTGR